MSSPLLVVVGRIDAWLRMHGLILSRETLRDQARNVLDAYERALLEAGETQVPQRHWGAAMVELEKLLAVIARNQQPVLDAVNGQGLRVKARASLLEVTTAATALAEWLQAVKPALDPESSPEESTSEDPPPPSDQPPAG